jgi:outer membrane protein assembly factor BamB
VFASPALDANGRVYIPSSDYWNLYVLTSKGKLAWSYELYAAASPSIGSDGTIYAGAQDGEIHAFTPVGLRALTYSTGGSVFSCPAIGSDGRIFAGSEDNRLYALSPAGSLQWSYATDASGLFKGAGTAIVDSGGTVIMGSDDNVVYAINSAGTLIWSYITDGRTAYSPSMDSHGRIFVGSGDNRLYCIEQVPTATPTPPIDLTADKTTFATSDRIVVTANVWPISTPCYPFVRVVMADGTVQYYVAGVGFTTSPTPYLGFEAGPITVGAPITGYPCLDAEFRGIAPGTYYLEGGAVDAAWTTSASNLVYVGTVDRETLVVQ